MYMDGHNHVIYRCGCGQIVAECPCLSNDKEIIRFDTCRHRSKKKVEGIPVYSDPYKYKAFKERNPSQR